MNSVVSASSDGIILARPLRGVDHFKCWMREARCAANLSQADLATQLGVDADVLASWESSDGGIPDAPTVSAIAKACSTSAPTVEVMIQRVIGTDGRVAPVMPSRRASSRTLPIREVRRRAGHGKACGTDLSPLSASTQKPLDVAAVHYSSKVGVTGSESTALANAKPRRHGRNARSRDGMPGKKERITRGYSLSQYEPVSLCTVAELKRWIEDTRRGARATRADIAIALDVDIASVTKWEDQGSDELPSAPKLSAFASLCSVRVPPMEVALATMIPSGAERRFRKQAAAAPESPAGEEAAVPMVQADPYLLGSAEICEWMRSARAHARLSQDELAAKVGYQRSTIANWEAGERQPTYVHITAIAEACGLEAMVRSVRSIKVQIRMARGAAGFSRAELGARANISAGALAAWEDDANDKTPRPRHVAALFDACRAGIELREPYRGPCKAEREAGQWIKSARIAANLSRAELASRLGVARKTVANWECGSKRVSLERIAEIDRACRAAAAAAGVEAPASSIRTPRAAPVASTPQAAITPKSREKIIVSAAHSAIQSAGAALLSQVWLEAQDRAGEQLDRATVLGVLAAKPGFEWLGSGSGWFWFGPESGTNGARETALFYALEASAGETVHAYVARELNRRGLPVIPPLSVLERVVSPELAAMAAQPIGRAEPAALAPSPPVARPRGRFIALLERTGLLSRMRAVEAQPGAGPDARPS